MNELQKENSLKFFDELKLLCLKNGIYKCEVEFVPFAEGVAGGDASGPLVKVDLCRRWPDPRCMTREFFDKNPFHERMFVATEQVEMLSENE